MQLIAQIGSQSMDIIRTNGEIKANEEGRKALEKDGKYPPGEGASAEEIKKYNEALVNSKAYQDVMREYGTGSDYQQAAQAVTAALQYLAGGDIGGAVEGASAPYVANIIKQQAGDNDTARIMAQAVLGAVVAQAQGNSAAAGAAGAATGELIAATVYPNKRPEDLTESERQIVSSLSTLAAGMAGGLMAGDGAGAAAGAGAGKTAVENNWLSETESRQLDTEMQACKASGGDCMAVVEKYIEISNKNSKELTEACTRSGVTCVTWEEVVKANTNVANDADPWQVRFNEKLTDPTAAALVNYLNGSDLQFLSENITTTDRVLSIVIDPITWPFIVMGGKAIITNAVTNTKEQVIAVGVTAAASAGIQYGVTGEVKLSDVIGSGVVGAITAGKGYNPTMTWNTVGGYYQAEIKGDDPFMAALLSRAGASAGYAAGNVIKVPMDKAFNPVSKQCEWVQTGVWTITKPVPQSSIPSISANIFDSFGSGVVSENLNKIRAGEGDEHKK